MSIRLLESKFKLPIENQGLISRPRLTTRINGALAHPASSVLICAPFGYGKTSVAVEWARSFGTEHCSLIWLIDAWERNDLKDIDILEDKVQYYSRDILIRIDPDMSKQNWIIRYYANRGWMDSAND